MHFTSEEKQESIVCELDADMRDEVLVVSIQRDLKGDHLLRSTRQQIFVVNAQNNSPVISLSNTLSPISADLSRAFKSNAKTAAGGRA